MRARKPARRRTRRASSRSAPSGTARRVSPFRLGQEGQSPTPRERELGSGCEIRRRRADGMGDGSAWSTGTLSQHLWDNGARGAPMFFLCSKKLRAGGQVQKQNKQRSNVLTTSPAPPARGRARRGRSSPRSSQAGNTPQQNSPDHPLRAGSSRGCVPHALEQKNGTVIYAPFTMILHARTRA